MKKILLFILICLPLCFFGCDKQNLKKLDAPKNLVVENGVITFERVANEGYYSIEIDELQIIADINNSRVEIYNSNNINYFAYNAQNLLTVGAEYTIKVQARANGKKSSDTVSTTYLHHAKLPAPTNLAVVGKVLSWNVVEKAENYEIEIVAPNAQTTKFTATRNLLDLNEILTLAGEYTFKVKATTSNENFLESDFATAKFENYLTLATPTNLSIDAAEDIVLSAEVDKNANAVMLKINDIQKVIEKQNSNVQVEDKIVKLNLTNLAKGFNGLIDFERLGSYNISLQAVYSTSAKNYYISSAFSSSVNYVSTKKLAAPNVEIDSKNSIVSWSSSEMDFVSGFKLEINLDGGNITTYIFDNNILSFELPENFVSVSVTALGRNFYLDSAATTVNKN